MHQSISPKEIVKFDQGYDFWWNSDGQMRSLHIFNTARLPFIIKNISACSPDLSALDVLDVGCGGGILLENLALNGINAHGLDASAEAILSANKRAKMQNYHTKLTHGTIEQEVEKEAKYDIVIASEIIEHVENWEIFLQNCLKICKPRGLVIISTINKTIQSLFFAKIAAEYILKIVPRGTHDWKKFIAPSEILKICKHHNFYLQEICGLKYNPVLQNFSINNNCQTNYIMAIRGR